ncbi:MAG: bifunctional phosphopantothenoylcysteine decarboxylase/phosphopantothenate--cysteine ligase CoaBC [Candidatus Abyssobacteria bacterium SURF_17]|uniref:Coenzyme A biosynthesis bifunctional protein CoaBC n=1 Tax=Candidatus Abyssobacteria bacterium SURF_17 TaxID=2093361 RepID=A0A419F737_9BACT|nr:MAG: bifunctional phosphopantothenoylcysteine decarboxylase/phosphopantothenate--cysteine ligase CoaBC [Candidatus Abyssubacteria bacterium SURF_17]
MHDKVIVVGVSGGIAAYKACDLASKLRQSGAEVNVIMTNAAQQFVTPLTFQSLIHRPVITSLFTSAEEWEIEHISLAQRASLTVIAPATANVIGKLACGIADDFLTTFALATRAPILICPAMNCEMYANPVVQENLGLLRTRGFHIVDPDEGMLACGDVGKGRLAGVEKILERIISLITQAQDFNGVKVLVTAGPTHEPIDPVRYITNPSSGKMGYAIAHAARERGADVVLVSGPTNLSPPPGVEMIKVKTAAEMAKAVFDNSKSCKVVVGAAAVGDYAPVATAKDKIKKKPSEFTLSLKPTVDIIAELGKRKKKQVLVGFSVETRDLIENSRRKLKSKNLDLIVCNDVTRTGAGFATDTNIVTLLDKKGGKEELPLMTKLEAAHKILDRIRTLL